MALCNPYQQWFDNNGKPLAGGMLYSYMAGTTTPASTWQDATLSILNPNPVILDAGGFSLVWLDSAAVYKFRMTDPLGVQLWTVDNVSGNLLCAPSGGGGVEPGGPPTITAISPNSGPVAGGNQVTITGTNFDITATVLFNGTPATNVGVLGLTSLVATVPPGNAGTVSVTVTVQGAPVTLTNAYTYIAFFTVTGILPTSGSTAGGTAVTITGTNFSSPAVVTFGGVPAASSTVVNSTTITATTPPGSGAVSVVVTIAQQSASSPIAFTYVASPTLPTVTAISPASGSANGGTAVTITGTGFALGATVTIRGVAAANVVVGSATSITATTPPGAAGAATVSVTTGGQVASLTNAFTYLAVPTVTSVSPNSGPANAATAVTITGTNFAAGASVTFGGVAATSIVVVNSTTITCTTPSHAAGVVAAAVTVAGQTGTLTNAYTYVAPSQPIYGGVGANVLTGTAGVNVVGGVVYLNTGEALTELQTTPETVGQSFGPFAPTDQSIYLLLVGSTHTFLDQNNNTFAMDPPIQQTVSGRTMYLYPSTNPLYLTWTIKVAT